MARAIVAWAPERRRPALVTQHVVEHQLVLPADPDSFTYRVRFHGQRTFIRATRRQAEQALVSGLGEVRAERVMRTETTYVEVPE